MGAQVDFYNFETKYSDGIYFTDGSWTLIGWCDKKYKEYDSDGNYLCGVSCEGVLEADRIAPKSYKKYLEWFYKAIEEKEFGVKIKYRENPLDKNSFLQVRKSLRQAAKNKAILCISH